MARREPQARPCGSGMQPTFENYFGFLASLRLMDALPPTSHAYYCCCHSTCTSLFFFPHDLLSPMALRRSPRDRDKRTGRECRISTVLELVRSCRHNAATLAFEERLPLRCPDSCFFFHPVNNEDFSAADVGAWLKPESGQAPSSLLFCDQGGCLPWIPIIDLLLLSSGSWLRSVPSGLQAVKQAWSFRCSARRYRARLYDMPNPLPILRPFLP
ncbi:hypothetical protein IWZ01DRAFT_184006 [Phyllosticta capitalensis]